jgi:uncharacterized membrane protein YeaQ/YmgE (transglycosylase-associated protein family)
MPESLAFDATGIPPQDILITWLVFGLVAGAAAKLIMPGRDPGGLIVTCLIGVVGGFLGNWIYGVTTGEPFDTFRQVSLFGLFLAVLGGIVLLFLHRTLFGRRR